MNKSFGDKIKQHRLIKGLTQVELCDEVKRALQLRGMDGPFLTQPTLSAWEVNRQVPSGENIAVLQALEQVLKLPAAVVKTVLSQTGKRAGSAPDDTYVDDIETWVESVFDRPNARIKNPCIWFLAPNTLPAFLDTTDRLFGLWRQNILKGVQYHMLWILEEIADGATFTNLGEYLDKLRDEIESQVAARQKRAPEQAEASTTRELGSVSVYLVRRPRSVLRQNAAEPLAKEKNRREFTRLAKSYSQEQWPGGWIAWHDLGTFQPFNEENSLTPDQKNLNLNDRLIYDLIENVRSQLFGRIAVYTGGQFPVAGLLLTGTSSRLGADASRCYRWLDSLAAGRLEEVIDVVHIWIKETLVQLGDRSRPRQ